ncbi:hypothetical protein [Actinoplanes xinjiangensis]|uniref:Uncharacterized protein n=1 Tax=Actinoplanes xinjiangensis TaxID=512350 RepID=A0A316FHD6_9ACTN|nr:hypothetical protein [Actinoplanes xinjiangensis]PWK48338.1 hypothetical protein BC793_106368 [Actinoplanes xinjiangensis]
MSADPQTNAAWQQQYQPGTDGPPGGPGHPVAQPYAQPYQQPHEQQYQQPTYEHQYQQATYEQQYQQSYAAQQQYLEQQHRLQQQYAAQPAQPQWQPSQPAPPAAPFYAEPAAAYTHAPVSASWPPPSQHYGPPVPPAGPPAPVPSSAGPFASRNVRIGLAGFAAVLVAGAAVATGVSSAAKSELCDRVGHTSKLVEAPTNGGDPSTAIETAAERIHTLSGRLLFSGDLKEAGEGLADAMDSMVTLQRSGYEHTDDVSAGTAAQMEAIGFSLLTSLGNAQRACGLPVTGTRTPE